MAEKESAPGPFADGPRGQGSEMAGNLSTPIIPQSEKSFNPAEQKFRPDAPSLNGTHNGAGDSDILRMVTDRLEGAKRTGNGYKALCPAHEDRTPSLSVKDGTHKVLVHCHAGCTEDAICRAMDIDPKALNYPKTAKPKPKAKADKGRMTLVAEYRYTDAGGNPVFQTVRYRFEDGTKTFRQRRPDGNGGWVWGLDGIDPILYRLPELAAAPADQWVFVVEGEKDADRLCGLGLVATTNAMGAGKWRPGYAETLRGRKVCILPDNDAPGRNHAQDVAESLLAVGVAPVVIELPDLPVKGDVSDWLDAGGDAATLIGLANAAPPYAPQEGKRAAEDEAPKHSTWPYAVENGRLVLCRSTTDRDGNETVNKTPIADLEARIAGEITPEDGAKTFVIEGIGIRSGKFTVEIAADKYGDTARLTDAIEAVSSRDGIHAGMRQHIGPAIKKMTGETWTERRFNRTGWADGRFLIPGRVAADVRIELGRKMPYEATGSANLDRALAALPFLVQAPGAERGAVILAHMLQAPMARLAGWENERCGVFLKGRSGTMKTSTAQAFMTLYGPGFAADDNLITLGDGSTTNAVVALATAAHDMPILFDNYKPNTGKGQAGLVGLIHRIFEGGDKDRLNRNAELRDAKPIHSWPLFTGEDLPSGDPASLARVLVIPFERGRQTNEALTKAQGAAADLCAVGALWIGWLESDAGRNAAAQAGKELSGLRDQWIAWLVERNPNMVNPGRVATNLATNAIAWSLACQHPTIGPVIAPFLADYERGLRSIAMGMGNHTEQGLEGSRYLWALRELLATGRAILLADDAAQGQRFGAKMLAEVDRDRLQDRVIGWIDGNGGAYLYPATARKAIALTLGDDLSAMTDNTLYDQLVELGAVQRIGQRATILKRLGGDKPQRVLHIQAAALIEDDKT